MSATTTGIDPLRFLDDAQVRELYGRDNRPVYVYSRDLLAKQAKAALLFDVPYGLTVRYAMKANPHPEIINIFNKLGIQIDASSGYEAEVALEAGVDPERIMITTQELPGNLESLVERGAGFTACSMYQLEEYGKIAPGTNVAIRINPGIGAGENKKVTTSGLSASFGIWYAYLPQALALAKKYNLTVSQLHTHVGVGTDPAEWASVAHANLDLVKNMPDVVSMSLGGGFKMGRMYGEPAADMTSISEPISAMLVDFAKKTGRKIGVEIEPGTFMVANAGSLLASIVDVKDTGPQGYNFLILNVGMGEFLRSTMYGSQHPLVVVPSSEGGSSRDVGDYVVVGHCCESSDVFTVASGASTEIEPRLLQRAEIGDLMCIEGVGAYCASMSAKGYNSFPTVDEVFVD